MKTKKIYGTSYSPSIQQGSGSYSVKGFYETSATKNTISEIIKNKTVVFSHFQKSTVLAKTSSDSRAFF